MGMAEVFIMDWSGLWQGILSNGIYAILILGAGAMLALLKTKWPELAPKVLYGIAGATCVAVLIFTFTGRAILSTEQRQIKPENVETEIKTWISSFGYAFVSMSDNESYFTLRVTLPSGKPIMVSRTKQRDQYITVRGAVAIAPQHLTILTKMPQAQVTRIRHGLAIELARSKIGFVETMPLQLIMVEKRIPITTALTESMFMDTVDEVELAQTLVIETVLREIGQ
jgi:hypothetical protein